MDDGLVRRERLRTLVRADLDAVAYLLGELDAVRTTAGSEPSPVECMAIAGYLHHAYTGMEAAIERMIRELDGSLPGGPRAHRDLLEAATAGIPAMRPPVISKGTRDRLFELLSFRHAYRHGYATRLEWARLEPLVLGAHVSLDALRTDLDAVFAP